MTFMQEILLLDAVFGELAKDISELGLPVELFLRLCLRVSQDLD
jgi:hypothetical protein